MKTPAAIPSETRPRKSAVLRCDALARWKASVETLVAVRAASAGANPATEAKVLRLAELRGLIALLQPAGSTVASSKVGRRELESLQRVYRLEIRRLQAEIASGRVSRSQV